MNGEAGRAAPTKATSYVAAVLGALVLGIADLLSNQHTATTLKLGEVFRLLLPGSQFEYGPLLGFGLLLVLGLTLARVYKPATRADAFGRGFSVFAILAVAVPASVSEGSEGTLVDLSGSLLGVPAAHAQIVTLPSRFRAQRTNITIDIQPEQATDRIGEVTVTVRDAGSGKILERRTVDVSEFVVSQTPGDYIVAVEAPDYRRSSFNIRVGSQDLERVVTLRRSYVPLAIQRLYKTQRLTVQ